MCQCVFLLGTVLEGARMLVSCIQLMTVVRSGRLQPQLGMILILNLPLLLLSSSVPKSLHLSPGILKGCRTPGIFSLPKEAGYPVTT